MSNPKLGFDIISLTALFRRPKSYVGILNAVRGGGVVFGGVGEGVLHIQSDCSIS